MNVVVLMENEFEQFLVELAHRFYKDNRKLEEVLFSLKVAKFNLSDYDDKGISGEDEDLFDKNYEEIVDMIENLEELHDHITIRIKEIADNLREKIDYPAIIKLKDTQAILTRKLFLFER